MKRIFLKICISYFELISDILIHRIILSNSKVNINLFLILEEWNIDQNPDFSEFSNILSVNYLPERNTKLTLATRYGICWRQCKFIERTFRYTIIV